MSPEDYIKAGEARGVERVLLLDPPEVTFPLKKLFGDYVIPVIQVNMDTVTQEEIEEYFNRGAVGIKFIAPAESYGADVYLPLYDVVRARRGLAVFHTGFLATDLFEPGGVHGKTGILDITDMRPAALDRIARAFPELKMLMAHFGNPWWEEAWKMISSHKNIYADFSGGTAYRRSMNMWKEIFAPNGKLDTGAVEKLCFGTDGQYFAPDQYGAGEVFDFYDAFFDQLQVPVELQERVDRGNLLSLLPR